MCFEAAICRRRLRTTRNCQTHGHLTHKPIIDPQAIDNHRLVKIKNLERYSEHVYDVLICHLFMWGTLITAIETSHHSRDSLFRYTELENGLKSSPRYLASPYKLLQPVGHNARRFASALQLLLHWRSHDPHIPPTRFHSTSYNTPIYLLLTISRTRNV